MINSVEVFLWGKRIGILYQNENSLYADFEYDRDFQKSGIELSPFKMPLGGRVYSFPELGRSEAFHGLPGLVADSLPDKFGNAVINSWLARTGRSPEKFTALDRLCYTGKRGMGALEYQPASDLVRTGTDLIDLTEMTKLASDVLANRTNQSLTSDDVSKMQLLEIGSSAGGARAKAIIAWNEKTGEIRSGQINAGDGFEYWLIKFDGVKNNGDHELADPNQYTLIEYAYYLMAKDLGIEMSECRVIKKDGLNHFMTKRFDRINGEKVHMQTLAALCHFDYNYPNICSYEEYALRARQLGITKKETEQIYKRMVYNVIGVNCDDHVKNFSFMMNKAGKWSITPAYDLTYSYNPLNRWISQHQMSVNGKSSDITDEDMMETGKKMGLSSVFCRDAIGKTRSVINNWMHYAEKSGLSEERANEVNELLK